MTVQREASFGDRGSDTRSFSRGSHRAEPGVGRRTAVPRAKW